VQRLRLGGHFGALLRQRGFGLLDLARQPVGTLHDLQQALFVLGDLRLRKRDLVEQGAVLLVGLDVARVGTDFFDLGPQRLDLPIDLATFAMAARFGRLRPFHCLLRVLQPAFHQDQVLGQSCYVRIQLPQL